MDHLTRYISSADELAQAEAQEAVKLEANPNIEMRGTLGKGRGLFWCGDSVAKKGTTLLCLKPLLVIPDENAIQTKCYVCFSKASQYPEGLEGSLKVCSACNVVRYCSYKCQEADEAAHRVECIALQKCRPDSSFMSLLAGGGGGGDVNKDPGMHVRSVGRLFWEAKRLGKGWSAPLEKLMMHEDEMSVEDEVNATTRKAIDYIKGVDGQAPAQDELRRLFNKFVINCCRAQMPDLETVGLILEPISAMINHSCLENVSFVSPEGFKDQSQPLHIVALRDLQPGEELLYQYGEGGDHEVNRQSLIKCFKFACQCQLCTNLQEHSCECEDCGNAEREKTEGHDIIDPKSAFYCGRLHCQGLLHKCPKTSKPVGLCSVCKQSVCYDTDDIAEFLDEADKLVKGYSYMLSLDWTSRMLGVASEYTGRLSVIQPPSAYPFRSWLELVRILLFRLLRSSSDAEVEMRLYIQEELIRTSYLELQAYEQGNEIYKAPFGHVGRALVLNQVAFVLLAVEPIEFIKLKFFSNTPYQPASKLFMRFPSIPIGGKKRTDLGLSILRRAIEELKVAFGVECDGGIEGRKAIQYLNFLEVDDGMVLKQRHLRQIKEIRMTITDEMTVKEFEKRAAEFLD